MILFKYTPARWGLAILRNLRLKVTPPNEFNDPFEFTPATTNPIASLDGEKLALLNDWLHREGLPDSSIEGLQKVLPELKRTNPIVRKFPAELVHSDMAARHAASQHLGVLCLSEYRANLRMWAHYGDEHRGLAVGFDLDKETSGIDGAFSFKKVEYTNARPRLNPMLPVGEEFHEQMLKITSTKSKVWQDELEHRMFFELKTLEKERRKKGDRKIWNYVAHIRPETIREVAMGCFISQQDERKIRSVIEAKLPHVKLLKMRRHDTEFELVAVPAD